MTTEHRIEELYGSIFACEVLEDVSKDILKPLSSIFGASSSALLSYSCNPGGLSFGRGTLYALSGESLNGYSSGYFEMDPIFHWADKLSREHKPPSWRVASYHEITSKYALSSIFRDFLESIGVGDVLAGVFPVTHVATEYVNLSFHRPPGSEPFARNELMLFNKVGAAIGSVISGLMVQDALRLCKASLDLIEDEFVSFGVATLSESGAMGYYTKLGARFLTQIVHDYYSNDGRELAKELKCRNQHPTSTVQKLILGGTTIVVRRVEAECATAQYLLLITKTGDDLFQVRCRQMKLTEREVEISQLMSAGLPDKRIATTLCISTRTVQNHLRSIYHKANVHSRSQFLAGFLSNQ